MTEHIVLLNDWITCKSSYKMGGGIPTFEKSGRPVDKLKRIRSMVFLHNNSIFAHGLGPVSGNDFMKFRAFVIDIFKEFCEIEDIDFERYSADITWLNPIHSQNYVRMEASESWQ